MILRMFPAERSTMSRWLTLCLLALLLAGCGSTPRRELAPDTARTAEALYREGAFARAAQAFLDAAEQHRSRRNWYQLRAAEAWRELGDLEAARAALDGAGRRRLDEVESLRLDLLLAELALDVGNHAHAQDLLTRPHDSVPEAYRARYHDLAARAWEGTDPFTAAAERAWLQPFLLPAERADNLRAIEALLVGIPDRALATRTAALPPGHPLYRHAGRALSVRGLPLPRAEDRTIGWQSDGGSVADADGYRPPARVALLLPEQGPLAAAGRAVREGFLAAYFEESRTRPQVLVFDTGLTPEDAHAAYRRAVAAGVDAVVGPLSRESVGALFERADISVPVLALNRSTGAPPPPGSLSFALAPEDEAVAVAERLAHGGARRVVAIASAGDNGARSLSAFRARFEALGGTVAAETLLAGTDPDYSVALNAAFAAAGQVTEPMLDALGNETLRTRAAADALFLAVDPQHARLLVPQLNILGTDGMPRASTSAIHAVAGNAQLDRDFDGIVVTEVPWLLGDQPGIPRHARVAEELPYANGPGGRLVAFGIDAFRLLSWLEYLAAHPDARLQGATGALRIDGFGRVLRDPGWGVFRNGRLRPLQAPAEAAAPGKRTSARTGRADAGTP